MLELKSEIDDKRNPLKGFSGRFEQAEASNQ
jgi:hypothetical protein